MNAAALDTLRADLRTAAARRASFGQHGRISMVVWSWGVRLTVRSHGEADPFRMAGEIATDLRDAGWSAHASGTDVVVDAEQSAKRAA